MTVCSIDTLFSDIDSLMINAGVHRFISGNIIAYYQNGFRLPFIIGLKIKPHEFTPFLIVEDTRHG